MRGIAGAGLCIMWLAGVVLLAGCEFTPGAKSAGGKGEVSKVAVYNYLATRELAREEIVNDVYEKLQKGKRYRQRVQDQRNRWTLMTVWLDRENEDILHIVTKRDDACPKCNGTGRRDWSKSNEMVKGAMNQMPFGTQCLGCGGTGVLVNHVEERKFVLSPGDYIDSDAAKTRQYATAMEKAPEGAGEWIEKLGSDDPKERLAACEWLDANFVRKGLHFRTLSPMLAKARWQETNDKKQKMVYQFWAGRGDAALEGKAYYRIYIDAAKGEVESTGFFPLK